MIQHIMNQCMIMNYNYAELWNLAYQTQLQHSNTLVLQTSTNLHEKASNVFTTDIKHSNYLYTSKVLI